MSVNRLIECLDALPDDAKLHVNPTLTFGLNAFGEKSTVFIKSDDVITVVQMKQLIRSHTNLVAIAEAVLAIRDKIPMGIGRELEAAIEAYDVLREK